MKYLKVFETEAEYTAYKNGSDFVTPNVSYIRENRVIEYNKASLLYNMVDLGLPSGILWADRNVGASSPEDAGLYFQWGDVTGYTAEQAANGEKVFNWTDYFDTTDNGTTFNKYSDTKLTVLEASDDAATVNMGSEYRMPTKEEMLELKDNCVITFIDVQDNAYSQDQAQSGAITEDTLKGVRITGTNGNSIFIPYVGVLWNSAINTSNFGVWESKVGNNPKYGRGLLFTTSFQLNDIINRSAGLSVRAVKSN